MYYRISKNEKNLFFGKKIAQVWAVTLSDHCCCVCVNVPLNSLGHMEPWLKVSSHRLVKPGLKLMTPGL